MGLVHDDQGGPKQGYICDKCGHEEWHQANSHAPFHLIDHVCGMSSDHPQHIQAVICDNCLSALVEAEVPNALVTNFEVAEQSNDNEEDEALAGHPGRVLWRDFMDLKHQSVAYVAQEVGVNQSDLQDFVDGNRPVWDDLDRSLATYYDLPAGFFQRLQDSFDNAQA